MGEIVSLRKLLRESTRAHHEAVDLAFSAISIATRPGLSRFLLSHELALRRCQTALQNDDLLPLHLKPVLLLPELRRDLNTLRIPILHCTDQNFPVNLNAVGMSYVIAGSRLGAKMLKRQWSKSSDGTVLNCGAYLSSEAYESYWPKFLDFLESIPDVDGSWEQIVKSASATFLLFGASLERADMELTNGKFKRHR